MIKITQITLLICIVMKLSQTQALVQLRTSLASSDNPLLAKILQSIDAATSDEHLFEVTLKLLKSLCVCMRDTLKAKEETFNSAKNLIGLSKTVSTEGKVLDLYKKIYNNTCFNLKHDLSKRSNTSSESWSHSNCGKEDRQKKNNTQKNEEDLQTVKNVLKSKLDHILYRALVQTRHHHKYNIKKYNLFGKVKSRVKSSLKHTLIVILTLHPEHKDLSKYNIVEEDLHKVLHKNSTIDIDIIDTKYDQEGKESKEAAKPEVYSDCHLQSLYTYLAESEKKNLTKVFRFLRRRDTIKIYIEVFTGRNHSDYINICCTNGSISVLCKKELIQYIDSQENITVQYKKFDKEKSMALKNSFKNTISKLKQLVKRLDYKSFNNSTPDLNIRNVDISHNITSTNKINNGVLAMKEKNSITDQLGLKQNGLPNFVENLTHPLKLQDVSRAIILLNDFVSKQTTTDNIKSSATNQADYTKVDLMNTLALTEVPFTESNKVPFEELSLTTTSNLPLFKESATNSEKEIETIQDTTHMMTVDKQDGIDFNKNVALELNDTELPALPKSFKTKAHIFTTSATPYKRVTNKSHPLDVVFTDLDNEITIHDINNKMVSINDKNKPNIIFKNVLQHKLPSYKTLKDMFLKYSTISYDTNLPKMPYTKQFSPSSNRPHIRHVLKHENNMLNKNQDKVTRENEKTTTTFKFEKNDLNFTENISKYMSLLKLKIRNDTIPKPFTFSISKHPENFINVNFPHVQQESKQDTLTTQHKDGNSTTTNKRYYLEQSTGSMNNTKLLPKNIVNLQIAITVYNNGNISTNNFGPKKTKNWRVKKNKKTTDSKWSNILHSYSKTTHIDKLRPTPFNFMQTSGPHHKQNLQSQNATDNSHNTFSKHDKLKSNSASIRYSFTSTTKSLETFLTSNNVFKIKADNTFPERPNSFTKRPIMQGNKEKEIKLSTKVDTSLIQTDQTLPSKNDNSHLNSDSLITPHLGVMADRAIYKHLPTHTWLSVTTNKTHNVKALNSTSRDTVNSYDRHKKVSKVLQDPVRNNVKSKDKNTVTSSNRQLEVSNKTTRKINDIFENTIDESYPAADSLLGDSMLANGIHAEHITVVSIQSTMPFVKFTSIPTKLTSSDKNAYYKYENVTAKIAPMLNATTTAGFDKNSRVKTVSFDTKTIKANMEWNSQSVTTISHFDGTKTFKESSTFFPRDKNTVLNLSNMINNRDVDIKTLSSTTAHHSNPLDNRNKKIKGKPFSQKISTKNHEIEFYANDSTMLHTTKLYSLQNTYNHVENSRPVSSEKTISFTKSSTQNVDDDGMVINKQKVKETHITSTIGLTKVTNMSTLKSYTINYGDRDPIENTINFIETFEDQIELNVPNDKSNTKENYKPKNIESTRAIILTRTTNNHNYSTGSSNKTERDKSSIDNTENITDEQAIRNSSLLSINSMSTKPIKYTLPNTENVIYQEPLMSTEITSYSTSPIAQKYNQSSTTPLNRIENNMGDLKNNFKDIVKNKNVVQKHITETSGSTEKYSLLNTKAAISEELYDEMENSVFITTAKELNNLGKTRNTEFNSMSDQDDEEEFLTKSLLAENDENSSMYTTIDPQTQQNNYVKTFENVGKNIVPEIKETILNEPYDFKLTENVMSQTNTERLNKTNTIKNIISRSELTILPKKPTFTQHNVAPISKITSIYSQKNINDTMYTKSYNVISEPINVTLSSAMWSTTKNYGSNAINIDNVTKGTNEPTETRNTKQTFENIKRNTPFKNKYNFLVTENTEFNNMPDALYDEWFTTNSSNTAEIINSSKNIVSRIEIADLTTTPTISEQNIKKTSNDTSRYNSNEIKDTMFRVTESYNAISEPKNVNLTNAMRNTTKNYENVSTAMKYIDHIAKRTNGGNKSSQKFEIITKNMKPYRFLGTKPAEFDKTSETIYNEMFDTSVNNKKDSTSRAWITTKNFEYEVNNSNTDIVLVMKVTETPINSAEIQHNTVRALENITKNTPFNKPYDLLGTENIQFKNTSDPTINTQNKTKDVMKAIESIENRSKITKKIMIPSINIATTSYSSNTLKYSPKNIRNAMFTELYKVILDPGNINKSSTVWDTTKKHESHINSIADIYDKTQVKDRSRQTTKIRNKVIKKIKAFIKYTSPITKNSTYVQPHNSSSAVNIFFSNTSDELNSINNIEGTTKTIASTVNGGKITTHSIVLQQNVLNPVHSTLKHYSNNIKDKMFTESYNALLETRNVNISTTKKYVNDEINIGNIDSETIMKNTSRKVTKTQNNATRKFESIIKYTSPITRSTTDDYVFYDTPDPILNKMFETNTNNEEDIVNAVKINKSRNDVEDLTTNHVFPQNNINNIFKYHSMNQSNKIFTESYNAVLESRTDNIFTTKQYGNGVINIRNTGDKSEIKEISINTTKTQNDVTQKFESITKYTSPMTRSIADEYIFHKTPDPIHNKMFGTNFHNTKDIEKNKSSSKIKDLNTNPIFPHRNTKAPLHSTFKYNLKNFKDIMFTESYNAISKPKNVNNNTARIYENNVINTGNINIETKMKDTLKKTTKTENNAKQKFERVVKFTSPMTRTTSYKSVFHTSTDPIYNKFLGTNSNNADDIIKAITINKSRSKLKGLTSNQIFLERNTKAALYSISKYNSKNIKDKMFTESYNAISKSKNVNNSCTVQSTTGIYENSLINTGNINIETKMKDTLMKTTGTEKSATQKFERVIKYTSPMTRSTTYKSVFHTSTDPIHNKILLTNSNNTNDIRKAIKTNKSISKIKSLTTNQIFPELNTKAASYSIFKYNSKNIKDNMFTESYNAISEQENGNKSSRMGNTTKKYEHSVINSGNLDNEAQINKISRQTTEKPNKYTQKFKSVLKYTLPMTSSTTYKYVFHNIPDPIHNKVFGTNSNNTEDIIKTIKVNKSESNIKDFTTNPSFPKTNKKATSYINLNYRPNNTKGAMFPVLYKYVTKHTNFKVASKIEKTTKKYEYDDNNIEAIYNSYNITVALSNTTRPQTNTFKSQENIIKHRLAIVNNTTFKAFDKFLAIENTKLYNTTKPIINELFSTNSKNTNVLLNTTENIVSTNNITDLTTNTTFPQRNIEATLISPISPKHMKDTPFTDSYNAISEPIIPSKIWNTTKKYKNGVNNLSNIDYVTKVTNTSTIANRTRNYDKEKIETSTNTPFQKSHKLLATKNTQVENTSEPIHTEMYLKNITSSNETQTMQKNFTILKSKNAGTRSPLYTKKVYYNLHKNGDILNNTFDADNRTFKLKDQIPITKFNVTKNNVEIKKIQNIITKSILLQNNLLKTFNSTVKYIPLNNEETLFYKPSDDETESTVFETAIITTNDKEFWSNQNTTKKHERKESNIISNEDTLENNKFKMFNAMPYTQTNIEDTTVAELYNFEDTENDTPKTTLKLNVTVSLSKLNNTEIYYKNAKVLKGIDKTQDAKINLIPLQNKTEHTPRNILKYTTKTDTTVFIAPYNSNEIETVNMDPNLSIYEGINKEKLSKIADIKTTNPSENIADISKILNKVTNPTDANKNIAISFQSTTTSTRMNTTFEEPIINTKYLLKPHNIKNVIDVNEIKNRQKKTTALLGSTIKFAQPNIQFIIFKELYNKTDTSEVNPKIARLYPTSTNLNIVNVINDTPNSTPISTKNAFSEESSSFRVTESVFGNILIPTNYKKTLAKPHITKHNLNYTGKSKDVSKASKVLNSIFLQNILTTTGRTSKHAQSILNETLLRGTESTMFTTKPELRNIISKITTTYNNNLTTIGHKPILNKIASESHENWKNETLNKTQAPFYNLKSLTKAMSMKIKYFTSKPHTFVHPTKNKLKKVRTIKSNKSSYLETIWPSFVTKTISPILPTSVATNLLIINTTELQKQVILHKKTNTLVTKPNHTTVEKSKMNLKVRQFSEENTKKLMLSKKTPKNQELYSGVLSKPLGFNTDVTFKLVSPNSTILLKDITSAEVSKIHQMHTKKLLTAATPYTTPYVSVTIQSYKEILGPILNKKATNNRTQNHIDKTIVFNNYLYTKPVQKHDVLNKIFSENVTQSKSHIANATFSTLNNTFSGIANNAKLKTTNTVIEATKVPIFKNGGIKSMKSPITNDTINSNSSNLKTIKPNELELNIRVGIETTKDRIQFSLVSIDEKPTKMSHQAEPKSAKETSTKAFVLALGTNQVKLHNLSVEHNNDSLNSKMLTLMNLTRRANERKDIEEAITLSNDLKQIKSPVTTASIEKKAVTVITNTQSQSKLIYNIIDSNISTTDGGNKTIAMNSTVSDSKQKIEIMNASSTVQPTQKQHKKIVIKPASLTDQFTIETLKNMYQEHLQKYKNNVTDEIEMKAQMYVTNENVANSTLTATKKVSTVIRNEEEEDSDSLFKENDSSEDDNSMFVPHHVPKAKMKNLNNVTKKHNVTYSTTHRLPSHDNFMNSYRNLTGTNPTTYFHNEENKTALTFVIKDVKLQNSSKFVIEGHGKIKYNNDTTNSTNIKKKLHNETVYITPNQNIIIGKTNMSIAEISNISVGKPSAIETKKRNRKRKKLINALKYKNDIADILKRLVKTKKLDIKKFNSTNKKYILHGLLSKIRKPTIHINKTYMQNTRTKIPIKTNHKRLSDKKLHEEYQTQIDKPTRKSYFSHANDTQIIHKNQILKPADIVTRKENGNKTSNRSLAMTSTTYLTEVTKKREQKKPNPHSFTGIELVEIGGVLNSTKSNKFLNQQSNNNLQIVPAATFNEIEIKDKITKPVTSIPIILNRILSNTTNALSLMNSEIKDRTDYIRNNHILNDDNKPNLKLTTLTTTSMKAPIKTHFITIKISIPYLTSHPTTKKTSNEIDKIPTNIDANEFTPKPKIVTPMFNYQSKDSIDPLTPAVFTTNATRTNLTSTVQPKIFKDTSGIPHSLEILSDFTLSSAPDKTINTMSNLTLNDLHVRRHVNEQNKSTTESPKQVLNDINLNISNESISTQVYSAILNANESSKISKTPVLLDLSDTKGSAPYTEHISKYGTNLNITKYPRNCLFKAVSNEIPGNDSELRNLETKNLMYTTNEIVPRETQKNTNLFIKMTDNYTYIPNATIAPTIVTKVLNLKQSNLNLTNNSILEVRTRAQLFNKTTSNTLDLNSTYGLNYTTSSIHKTALKQIEKDQRNIEKRYFTSSTFSENNLMPTVTTNNPTIFNMNSNTDTDRKTTTVKFRTTDYLRLNLALLSNHQSSLMYTTIRTSNKHKENYPTPKISLNTTQNVLSTIKINLNQTTALVKNPYATPQEKLRSFETTYRDASDLLQDFKEKLVTKNLFTANTTSTTNQADIKIVYKRKENYPTPKISLNTTPNVLSTIKINLNQTTALVKNPYATPQENLNSFETTYNNLLEDFKEKIITKSLFTANTSTTNPADIKIVYKEVTQNPNETQVDATATVGKLNTINTQYVQTEIMPSLLKIKNSTKIDIAERDLEITTNFVKLPFHFSVEQKTPKREKSNLDNPQKTTQIIFTNAKEENNYTSHLTPMPLSTVSINHIISQIYILDPKSSKSIWSRYTKGNKRQNTKTTKIYQKSNKISESSTNINPSSRSNGIEKQTKNVEDVTVSVDSLKSNISYNDEFQNNKIQLTDVIPFNIKSYLTKITAHFLKNNSILQKQPLNQFKMRNSQNKMSHKVTTISSLGNSSKPKTSGLPNFVTVKYKDNNLKYTSRDDPFSPTSYKSNTESNFISTRKIKYNPLSTIFAESGSIDGKNVKIYSSRLNRYHYLRPPLTITNQIKYNTYQPPTEEDKETLKPKISPRPNLSCAILKTMRHKFHSTYEFMEFLKASNCSADNLTIHFNIKNNRFSKLPLKQNPNRKTNNIKHPGIKLTKKVFTKLGSKESLLTSFEKTKLYPVKPAQAVLPKLPPNIVKRISIGGLKKKEIMSMNTRDFFSQHRLATPSHLKSQNIKVRQNNPLFVNTRYSILRPKFNPLEIQWHKLDRPKTFFLPPRSEEKTFAEIYEVPFHHKKLNWKQQIGSVRAALQNNPGALFPTPIKASVSNVLDKPHTHPKTDWDIFRDKTDLSKRKLWGPPDFVAPSRPPAYDLSLPKPLTPTGDEYNLRQLQYRRNFQVTDWWLNDMYLKVRLPLPINSNPGMVFPRRHFAKMEEVADLGALFIDDILDYKEMLDRGELPLERATSREKGQPLCMEQFYRLLGVCRIPEVGKDRLELPAIKSGTEEQEELVVVACRNYFYPIPVKAVDRGRITPGEIQAQLLHAMVDAAGAPPAPRVGLLTSMSRDQWARAREHLVKDEMNRMNLELISRALCILCLDEAGGDRADTDPETNAMLRAMHGAGTRHHSANRWFDKTVQLIISSDGTVGMCYEHSSAEGVAVVRLAERALARAEVADRPAPPPALLPAPQAMKWNIVPEVQRTIEHAARELDRAISDLDFKVYTYRGYGREFMKSCRTSPDVYIQLAIQYAYYKMYGYLVTTYESASLRRFRQGRVDNIRSAHGAALAWAAAMCTAEASPLNDGTDEGQKKVSFNLYGEQKKLELFEEAARKQTSIMEANILGKGIDNHLLGLREMARETLGELPPVFCDATYKQMFEFKMSTSQVTTTTDGTFMGYGAVCPDGYGCCYNPKKDSIIFCIASFTSSPVTNTEAYRQSLEEALDSMKLMFQARKAEN